MLNRTLVLILFVSFVALAGCEGCRFDRLSPPEFIEFREPGGFVNDPQVANARVDTNEWEDVRVYVRYTLIPGELPLLAEEGEATCRPVEDAPNELECAFTFPGGHSLQTGQEMFYQWFIDYRRPAATDVSTTEGPALSFIIRPGIAGAQ